MNTHNKRILKLIQDYAFITLGMLVYVSAWVVFMWPKEIAGGGISGVSSLIQYATGIKVSITYFIINVGLLLLGVKILGKGFGAKTMYAIGITTLFFQFMPSVIPKEFIDSIAEKNSDLICAMMGGAAAGIGIGVSFNAGGSSGGTDIIALIINKYRGISPGKTILYLDLIIVGSSYFLFEDITKTLYGYVMIGAVSYTIDLIVSGSKQSLQIFIISKKYAEIANRLGTELNRGVTVIDAHGWYSQQPANILMVVARKYQASDIYRVVKEEDPTAFISVTNASGVFGEGFDKIKK